MSYIFCLLLVSNFILVMFNANRVLLNRGNVSLKLLVNLLIRESVNGSLSQLVQITQINCVTVSNYVNHLGSLYKQI